MNWKTEATAAISTTAAPMFDVRIEADDALASQLQDRLEAGQIAARDVAFATSLLQGFKRYESFTDRQRPFVQKLVGAAVATQEAAPVQTKDSELAAHLINHLAACRIPSRDRDFAESLLGGWRKWASFTDRQRPHVERLVAAAARMQQEAATLVASAATADVPATPVAAQPVAPQKAYTALSGLVSETGFARFTVGDLQLNLKNDGSLIWVKWHGVLVGRIDQWKHFMPIYRNATREAIADAVAMLDKVEADPLGMAQAEGIRTGRCACCSRTLTDPVSIAFGIGPVCRSRGWGM